MIFSNLESKIRSEKCKDVPGRSHIVDSDKRYLLVHITSRKGASDSIEICYGYIVSHQEPDIERRYESENLPDRNHALCIYRKNMEIGQSLRAYE